MSIQLMSTVMRKQEKLFTIGGSINHGCQCRGFSKNKNGSSMQVSYKTPRNRTKRSISNLGDTCTFIVFLFIVSAITLVCFILTLFHYISHLKTWFTHLYTYQYKNIWLKHLGVMLTGGFHIPLLVKWKNQVHC